MRKFVCFITILAMLLGFSMYAHAQYGSSSVYVAADNITLYAPRLGLMTWNQAQSWVARFGGGWYLPSIYQLQDYDTMIQRSGNDPLSLDKTWSYWAGYPIPYPLNGSWNFTYHREADQFAGAYEYFVIAHDRSAALPFLNYNNLSDWSSAAGSHATAAFQVSLPSGVTVNSSTGTNGGGYWQDSLTGAAQTVWNFGKPVSGWGAYFNVSRGSIDVFYGDPQLVTTITASGFYGFTSTNPFDHIYLESAGGTGTANFQLSGMVYPSSVPIPAAVWLLAPGLLGLLGLRRRFNK